MTDENPEKNPGENQSDDNPAPFERPSPGRLLKRAREGMRLNVGDVARDLRFAPGRVEALETDDYRNMPAQTFVRGYLRSYARLVRLPEEEVIAAYDEAQKPRVPPIAAAPRPARSVPRQARSGDKPVRLVTYLLVAILAALVFSWWKGRWEMPTAPRPTAMDEQEKIAAPGDQVAPAATAAIATEPGAIAMPAGVSPLAPTPAEPTEKTTTDFGASGAPATAADTAKKSAPETRKPVATAKMGTTPPATPPAVAENTVQVSLIFDGESWADVRDSRKQRLVYQNFKAGQSVTVAGVPPFKVYLSNAKAARMRYAGEPYDVAAHQTGIFARFSVGKAVQ